MLKGLLNADARRWVEREHAIKQVQCIRVRVREESCKRDLRHKWQVTDILLGSWGADTGECLLVGRAKVVQNLVELVDVVATLKERTSTQKLSKDTANGPDVD